MAMRSLAVFFLAIAATAAAQRPSLDEWKEGQKNASDAAAAGAAVEKKMGAVDKAIELMESLQAQVLAEGEKEAASYNKFACFCKDTSAEKSEAIKRGEDEEDSLVSDIESLSSKRDGLDKKISGHADDIKTTQGEIKEAEDDRAATLKEYTANEADLKAAISALEGAIKTLKAGKSPSLLQVQGVSKTVQYAVELADALGVGSEESRKGVAAFLQQEPANGNAVPMEDYKFHSNDIIETLEQLMKDFTDEKNRVDEEEVKSVQAHNILMEEKLNFVKQSQKAMDDAKKAREVKIDEIQTASKQLSTVEATLRDDKEYLMKLSQMCSDKAKTWDQRSQVRSDELSTLTQAIGIIKGSVKGNTSASTVRFIQQGVSVRFARSLASDAQSMENLEALAEEQDDAASFVQVKMHSAPSGEEGATVVRTLLEKRGKELKSTVLSALASKLTGVVTSGKDPFAKIRALISELIERLLAEAANEANQKGWCDKALADARQKRDYAAEEIATLNSEMASLESTRDKLLEELSELSDDIGELKSKRKEAEKMRGEEKTENTATVDEAQAGLDALNMCMDILDKFYKTIKKETVDLSLAQQPKIDAPDAGFKIGEAYTGAQSEAGGIMGMLEVMKSDFVRTISETTKAEATAEKDHLEFMTESGKSLAEKEQAESEKTEQRDDTLDKLDEADKELGSQTKILRTSIKELKELQPTCIDTGMSYEERVARREQEIESLNKAMCILEAYAQYGPEGLADAC